MAVRRITIIPILAALIAAFAAPVLANSPDDMNFTDPLDGSSTLRAILG